LVTWAILPAADIQPAFVSLHEVRESRLKGGCSQEWLPHFANLRATVSFARV
jgi:hypothetical protein